MAGLVGWKLYRVSDGVEIESWGGIWGQHPGFPNPLFLPSGDHVHAGEAEVQYGDYIVRPWMMEEPPAQPIEPVPGESTEVAALRGQVETQAAQLAQLQNALAELVALARAP